MEKFFCYPFVAGYYGARPLYEIAVPAQRFVDKVNSFPKNEGEAPLRELEDYKIIELLQDVELLDKSLRSCLSASLFDDRKQSGLLKKLWTDICIYEHPDMEFLMCLPSLVGCSYRNGEYGIAKRVEYQMAQWFKDHQIPKYDASDPLIFAYKRFVFEGDKGISDNDNVETRRVTNSIVRAMKGTDKALLVDFLYTTRVANVRGVELAVFRKKQFGNLVEYFLKDAPEHPEAASFFFNEKT